MEKMMSEQSQGPEGNPATGGISSGKAEATIGYGRPPKHSQFKPGQSGNPKGRPKGVQSLNSQRKAIYSGLVSVWDGKKTKRIERINAVDVAVLNKALKGDARAAQLAYKNAKELGIYDETNSEPTGNPMDLTKEEIARLSDEDLDTLIRILKGVNRDTERDK